MADGNAHLIAREEQKSVGVSCELIYRGEHTLQIEIVVRARWIVPVEGVQRRVNVQCKVDTCVRQCRHALVMVRVRRIVYSVDTNSVDAELLEVLNVSLATLGISDWVGCTVSANCSGGATRLIIHTADIEAVLASEERCITVLAKIQPRRFEIAYRCP